MVNEELVPRFTDPVNHWFDLVAPAAICATACTGWSSSRATTTRSWRRPARSQRSHEYGSWIIEAMRDQQAGQDRRQRAQQRTDRRNLPPGAASKCPAWSTAAACSRPRSITYPPQLAALNRTNINVQSLIVEAALTGDSDAVYHAVMLDPLTAAVCTLPQIHAMVSEMLEAQTMPKITFIGAGSFGFTRNLVRDVLTFDRLADATICLMDINPDRLEYSRQAVQRIVDEGGYPGHASRPRSTALPPWKGADYVIVTILAGAPSMSGVTTSKSPRSMAWTSTSATRAVRPASSAPAHHPGDADIAK
jgi:alpha-galactosidase/6-phospho-beta-glucosidase family protein